ncbi:MAG: SLBB domain-containing protein [Pseudomonadota bacterium]|nr:SLBB domain-containing protein [Pseudomonadota bacterium]
MINLTKTFLAASAIVLLASQFLFSAPGDDEVEGILNSLPVDQAVSIRAKMDAAEKLQGEIDRAFEEINTLVPRPEEMVISDEDKTELEEKRRNWIFGYDLFAASPTTFAPATNIPIPADYILGPGDVLSIRILGEDQRSTGFEGAIGRDGTVTIYNLAPIGVGGLTLEQAREVISNEVSSQMIGAETVVSLKDLRSIRIFMLGAAYMPGSYTVSSLTTISNALFVSGGVSEIGSLRNIELKREGKTIHTFDLYDLLLKGDTSQDMRLQSGDALFVPVIKKTVRMQGTVRRPSLYELKEGETLGDLVEYAGGFSSESLPNGSEINRLNKELGIREIKKVNAATEFDNPMFDGDIVNIPGITALDEINITLTGQFKHPGVYSVKNGEKISSILRRAGGFTESAYLYGAVMTRRTVAEMQDESFKRTADDMETAIAAALVTGQIGGSIQAASELIWRLRNTKSAGRLVVDIDPVNISEDLEKDIFLEDGDRIHIPVRSNSVTVTGDVYSPATLPFRSRAKSSDYIKQTGGLRRSAEKSQIFVILPDGQSRSLKGGIWLFGKEFIAPGSTIVIPRQTKPFDWLVLSESIAPIFANLATSAAAIKVLGDD